MIFQIVKHQTQMLEKHEQSFNKIAQDIETWINHKHINNSEVKTIAFTLLF